MKHIIQAVGRSRTYYVVKEGEAYKWRPGKVGLESAERFDTEDAARNVIASLVHGAGGGTPEIVQVAS